MDSATDTITLSGVTDLDSIIIAHLSDEAIGRLMRTDLHGGALHTPYTWYQRLCRVMDIDMEATPLPYDASFDWRQIYHIMTAHPLYIIQGQIGRAEEYDAYITFTDDTNERVRRLIRALASTEGTTCYDAVSGVRVCVCPHPQCDPSYEVKIWEAPPLHIIRTWSQDAVNMLGALIMILVGWGRRNIESACWSEKVVLRSAIEVAAHEGCCSFVAAALDGKLGGRFSLVDSYYQIIPTTRRIINNIASKEGAPMPETGRRETIRWSEGVLGVLLRNPHCAPQSLADLWMDWISARNVHQWRMDLARLSYHEDDADDHVLVRAFIDAIGAAVNSVDCLERVEFLVSCCVTMLDLIWGPQTPSNDILEDGELTDHEYIHVKLMNSALGTRRLFGRDEWTQWEALVDTVIRTLQAPVQRHASIAELLRAKTDGVAIETPRPVEVAPFANHVTRYHVARMMGKHFRRIVHTPEDAAAYYAYTKMAIAPLLGDDVTFARVGECYDAFLLAYNHGIMFPKVGTNTATSISTRQEELALRETTLGVYSADDVRGMITQSGYSNDEYSMTPHGQGGWNLLGKDGVWGKMSCDASLVYCRGLFYHHARKAMGGDQRAITRFDAIREGMSKAYYHNINVVMCPATNMCRPMLEWLCNTMVDRRDHYEVTEFLRAPFHDLARDRRRNEDIRAVGQVFRESAEGVLEAAERLAYSHIFTINLLSSALEARDWDAIRYALRLLRLPRLDTDEGKESISYLGTLAHLIYDLPVGVFQRFVEAEVLMPTLEYDEDGRSVTDDCYESRIKRITPYVWNEDARRVLDILE